MLAGDRPLAKAAGGGHELGTLMVALSRGGRCGGWAQLDPAATTTHSYRPGTSSWNVTSPVAPGLALHMQAAPTDGGLGRACGSPLKLGAMVTTAKCTSSKWGDEKFFIRHQRVEEDWAAHPEFLTQYDAAKACGWSGKVTPQGAPKKCADAHH